MLWSTNEQTVISNACYLTRKDHTFVCIYHSINITVYVMQWGLLKLVKKYGQWSALFFKILVQYGYKIGDSIKIWTFYILNSSITNLQYEYEIGDSIKIWTFHNYFWNHVMKRNPFLLKWCNQRTCLAYEWKVYNHQIKLLIAIS